MGDLAPILDRARRALLDLSARNRLLNTPRHRPRAAIVELVDERSAAVFQTLVRERKAVGFRARAPDGLEERAEPGDRFADLPPLPDEAEENGGWPAQRHDRLLQTSLTAERLQSRLLKLASEARSCLEERGVGVLHLALGFLEWYDAPEAREPRFAPLVLVPVRLERASALARFRLAPTGDELTPNLSLIEKLKADFGLKPPELGDPEELALADYFTRMQAAVRDEQRFVVHPDDIVLGLFSFTKLLMYRDLDPASWPVDAPLEQCLLVRALLLDGFRDEPDGLPDDARIDELVGPADMVHVLDADASQSVVIEEVRRGRDLLVQGPPGTGKSQTIANLIAGAVRAGKRVLFVAEKRAALEVVKRRLDEIGLGEMALELHSHKASKRALLDELRRTLALDAPKVDGLDDVVAALGATRAQLNRYAAALHTPLEPSGVSAFEAIGQLVRLARRGVAHATFTLPGLETWSGRMIAERRAALEQLAARAAALGTPARHVWRGVELTSALPGDRVKLQEEADRLRRSLAGLRQATRLLRRELGGAEPAATLPELRTLLASCQYLAAAPTQIDHAALLDPVWTDQRAAIAELARLGRSVVAIRSQLSGLCHETAWLADVSVCRRILAARGRSWFRMLSRDCRRARRELAGLTRGKPPRTLAEQLALLDALQDGQRALRQLAGQDRLGRAAFGTLWRGAQSDWTVLSKIERWERDGRQDGILAGAPARLPQLRDVKRLGALAAQLGQLLDAVLGRCRALFGRLELRLDEAFGVAELDALPLESLEARLAAWVEQGEALETWLAYRRLARTAAKDGLGPFVERLHDGRLEPGHAGDAFDITVYEPLLRRALRRCPALGGFDGQAHEQLIERFCELDRARIELARAEVARAHHTGLPKASGEGGQLGVLQRELSKQRRHLPIRQLLARAGGAVQAIKPVLMMSPLSVAAFLAPGSLRFDLLLIDEASQVEPVAALGAIARANQLVVVGDDRQLPPSAFFQGALADDGGYDTEAPTRELESILGLAAARGMPRRMLRRHYRSRHPSLIAVSNRELYDSRLQIPPSPFAEHPELGLVFHHLSDGVYERGGARINRIEARAVALAVIEHARARAQLSLGVGCVSVAQRNAILHELELCRRAAPELEAFFEPERAEPFFVKNLESIQGDERDVIFVSLGYGRDASGDLAMSFGPLNAEGGERRLNVLITRARQRLEVFASITADDIDLERVGGRGVAALKTFLQFAESGILEQASATGRGCGSPFEEQVAAALAGLGYTVESQVGIAGLFVDLAIRDPGRPGRYLLGIECDGAAYHGARSARDRDRLRQEVLEDQRWILHRIWSSDWYRQPERELRRLKAALEKARALWAARDRTISLPRPAGPGIADLTARRREHPATNGAAAPGPASVPYQEADQVLPGSAQPHLLSPEPMVEIVTRVIGIEGPVHRDEIARRVTRLCGFERTGKRIAETVERALARALRQDLVVRDGSFFMPADQDEPPVRDRSGVRAQTLRRPEMVPPAEIRAAALLVIRAEFGITPDEIVARVGRLLGFQSTSAALRALIEDELDRLIGERLLVRKATGMIEERQASVAQA